MLLECRDLWCCCYGVYTKGWGGVGGAMWSPCTSYVICCYAAEISGVEATVYTRRGGVGFKEQRSSLVCVVLAMAICESTCSAPAKKKSTLKRLVWKNNKERLSNESNEKWLKPSRNANLAKFSCENLTKFGSYKCAFRCSENNIKQKKTLFLRARFPVHRDVYVYVLCICIIYMYYVYVLCLC